MKDTSRKLILIVEDDQSIRTDLTSLLEMEGYEICSASNGAEALRLLHAVPENPSLIILDIMMPVMDGWGFRAEQLKQETMAVIPVVVMTADGHAAEKASQMKAQGFVQKPIHSIDSFLKVIQRFSSVA